jgi:hypothetical protein
VARRGGSGALNGSQPQLTLTTMTNMRIVLTWSASPPCGRSVMRQSWPLTDHFERLLWEAYPNHTYPINHKLKDCDMMKNFMISGSLTQDMEPEEEPSGRDVMPFPREDAVMTV